MLAQHAGPVADGGQIELLIRRGQFVHQAQERLTAPRADGHAEVMRAGGQ